MRRATVAAACCECHCNGIDRIGRAWLECAAHAVGGGQYVPARLLRQKEMTRFVPLFFLFLNDLKLFFPGVFKGARAETHLG